MWREEHGATATAVRQLLDSEAGDKALAPAVREARQQLTAHFQARPQQRRWQLCWCHSQPIIGADFASRADGAVHSMHTVAHDASNISVDETSCGL